MNSVPLDRHHGNFTEALLAAASRAMTRFPEATARITRGLSLVEADAVTDQTARMPHWYTVQSARDSQTQYDVVSNGMTRCTCPDYVQQATLTNGYVCKHGFAVLLVRAARRDVACPKLRHAYHLSRGEEGHCRFLADGRAVFHPGGHTSSVVCTRDELCVGPFVETSR